MASDDGYLLDNQQQEAGRRFDALATLFDPGTFRHFDEIGVSNGWHCWEVGAGGPSVAAWLAGRVGHSGRVLATDIDVAWLNPEQTTFEVRQHNVGVDPPPAQTFDVIHARLVLVHVVQREQALRSLVCTLRPGGWLLLEDADPALQPLICPDEYGPAQELANRLRRGFRQLMADRGVDLSYGRTLPRRLREAGLVDVRAEANFPIISPACVRLELATIAQIREGLVSHGIASNDEIERHLANVASGTLDLATAPMISAWGRAPA
jgi:SAM-dependent methyltransferase